MRLNFAIRLKKDSSAFGREETPVYLKINSRISPMEFPPVDNTGHFSGGAYKYVTKVEIAMYQSNRGGPRDRLSARQIAAQLLVRQIFTDIAEFT
jgi:hypothetical protein